MNVNVIKLDDNSINIDGVIYEKKPEPKPLFKIGDWVYWGGQMPTIGRISGRSGGEFSKCWILDNTGKSANEYNSCHESYLRLATPQEIELYLYNIIEEKYVGKNIKCLKTNTIVTVVTKDYRDGYPHSWTYDFKEDSFNVAAPHDEWYRCTSNPHIYEKGKWADIVIRKSLPSTKEELRKILIDFYGGDSIKIEEFLKEYKEF